MNPPDLNKTPDVLVYHPVFGLCFLPPVEGIGYPCWNESELDATIEQSIDIALDLQRFDVVEQLAKHV